METSRRSEILATTEAGKRLAEAWELPLGEYLHNELATVQPGDTSNPYFAIVAEEITAGLDRDGARSVRTDFERLPAMQLADGSMLLTDTELFLNNLGADHAVRSNNSVQLINQQCSTVSCVTNASQRVGPAFFYWNDITSQVFATSRNRLKHATPETLRDVTVSLTDEQGNINAPVELMDFAGQQYATGALALQAMNAALWKFPSQVHLYGEDLSARVVARAIEATELGDEFSDSERFSLLQERRASAITDPSNFILRDSTDFFYLVKGEKLIPARIVKGNIQAPGNINTGITTSKDSLANALREGQIFPDLTLTYAAMCLKSGVAAMGGLSQQEYLPQIAQMFGMTREKGRETSKFTAGIIEKTPQITGKIHDVLKGTIAATALQSTVMERTVGNLVDGMSNFDYYVTILNRRKDHS